MATSSRPRRGRISFASLAVALEWNLEKQRERLRDRCTVCRKRHDWFELEPGTGRCPDCMP